MLQYDVGTKTWDFVLWDFDIEASNAVLSADEQYVILVGPPWNYVYNAPEEISRRNHICGLDIRNHSEYTPFEYPFDVGVGYNAFVARSRWKKQVLLTYGWLRRLISSKVMGEKAICRDVVNLVNEYYCIEMIHGS